MRKRAWGRWWSGGDQKPVEYLDGITDWGRGSQGRGVGAQAAPGGGGEGVIRTRR